MATIESTGTGVSFALTDEQRSLRELAREFAAKEIRPRAFTSRRKARSTSIG